MGKKKRDGSGRFSRSVDDADVLGAVRAHDPAATSEIAEEVGISRQGADRRLRSLRGDGAVSSKKIGASLVWFIPRERGEWTDQFDADDLRGDATTTLADAESGHTRDESDAVGAMLDGWKPDTEADASAARAQTRRAVEWLRADGGRRAKSEFVDALAAESAFGERYWWDRAVQPGLRRFRDADLVEYRSGHHDYQWVGDEEREL